MSSVLKQLRFHQGYCFVACLWFLVLVGIAVFVKDSIIRPHLGDVLAVIWLFYALKTFFRIPSLWLSLFVLVFAYGVELLQYVRFIEWVGLENNTITRVVLGATFDPYDLVAYSAGWIVVFIWEWLRNRNDWRCFTPVDEK